MARKIEAGIDYFPINTNILNNKKVKLVIAKFGAGNTWGVLLPLLSKIYENKGYWIDWLDEDFRTLFAQDDCKMDLELVEQIVEDFVFRGLFDNDKYITYGILTSSRIQSNYFEATARRKSVNFIEQFMLESDDVDIERENVNINQINVNILSKKDYISTQSKVKESKVNKSKYRDNIYLSEEEHSKLVQKHGQIMVDKCYDYLRDYKIEKAYKTKSDYHTITRWVIEAVEKKYPELLHLKVSEPKVIRRDDFWNEQEYQEALKKVN